MSFSNRLKAIIKEESMTKKEFSEETGIPESSLNRYLYKNAKPTATTLSLIASNKHLSKYTYWLITGVDNTGDGSGSPRERIQIKCGIHPNDDNNKEAK